MRKSCVGFLLVLVLPVFLEAQEAAEAKPNLILIFCDDLGYGDLGCFGSKKHRTPHCDRMAQEGIRFTSFYVTSSVCTPSRSSLLTGSYPRRVILHENAAGKAVIFPVAHKGLHPDEVTIAEVLKDVGYATACIGKWHLGDQERFLPRRQGFDEYFGIPYSNDMGERPNSKRPPLPLVRNETVLEAPVGQDTLTRRYTEEAGAFIRKNKNRPFFLYLPHTFPHDPHHASDAFRGKSANGIYGDCVEELDASTGEILATLKELGIDERTLVVFTSDNGAQRGYAGSNAPLRGHKGSSWEGGQRVPCIMRWPGKIPAGTYCSELSTSLDILPTFAKLAGAVLPQGRTLDGHDIWPLMTRTLGVRSPHEAFYYYRIRDLHAIRSGKWKLHFALAKSEKSGASAEGGLLLYDLESDIGETRNVVDLHPNVVARLQELAQKARAELGHGERSGTGQRPAGMVKEPKPLLKSP